jgi:hypothetical protein
MMNDLEPEFVVSDLDSEDTPGTRLSVRRALALGTLAGVVILAGIGIFLLGTWQHHQHSATGTLIIPATPTVIMAPPAVPPLGQGWTNAGPAVAQTIAFAPSAPQMAYTCGVPEAGAPHAVIVGSSLDGGATWHVQAAPVSNTSCQISVDPLDARDVVLVAGTCASCQPPWLLRSRDGGATWTVPTLPPHGTETYTFLMIQWAGSDLYVAPYTLEQNAQGGTFHRLAVSHAGGPFQWVEGNGLYTYAPPDAQINQLIAFPQGLYVALTSTTQCPPACTIPAMLTTTGGATWSQAPTFQVATQPINVLGSIPDGQTLFGHIGMGPGNVRLVRSEDGGATWHILPAFPSGTLYDFAAMQTPDSTLFVELQFTDQTFGIFALAPTGSVWQLASASTTGNDFIAVSADAAGQPRWLWGQSFDQTTMLGHLQRHAP